MPTRPTLSTHTAVSRARRTARTYSAYGHSFDVVVEVTNPLEPVDPGLKPHPYWHAYVQYVVATSFGVDEDGAYSVCRVFYDQCPDVDVAIRAMSGDARSNFGTIIDVAINQGVRMIEEDVTAHSSFVHIGVAIPDRTDVVADVRIPLNDAAGRRHAGGVVTSALQDVVKTILPSAAAPLVPSTPYHRILRYN